MRRAPSLIFAAIAMAIAGGACLPGSGPPLLTTDDAGAAPPVDFGSDDASTRSDVDLGDPFAVDGATPSHGPWTGGTRTVLHGRGFSSKLRVWIGGKEIDKSAIVASDPRRAAIITPPGPPGAADVRVQNEGDASERTLVGGFYYDAFVVEPTSGTTTGGTRIALRGMSTNFAAGSAVAVGGKACTDVAVVNPSLIECTTAANTVGQKEVTVTPPAGVPIQARDAFTYLDAQDDNRGGLSGGVLAGTMHVHVLDAWTGIPLPAAKVVAGGSLATGVTATTDITGTATITGTLVGGPAGITITAAAKCHQPITFVDVAVDTVTAYLSPVLDIKCAAQGDPPSGGGGGFYKDGGAIEGQLVWPGGIEFKRAGWGNVPLPVRSTERQAAYIFRASGSPFQPFYLPNPNTATTPESPGGVGYAYGLTAAPGNLTIYALAGIEDRAFNPPHFTAYAMGVARGVLVLPSTTTTDVDIAMTTLLDHQVTITPQPPVRGVRGPDRFLAQLGVTLGQGAYATLPVREIQTFLPMSGNAFFTGVPALDGALASESYQIGASASTGPSRDVPYSVVANVVTRDTNNPVVIGGFVEVPTLVEPSAGAWSGTHIDIGTTATTAADLIVVNIDSSGGLVRWTIVSPASKTSFDVPNLEALGPQAGGSVGLVRGTIRTSVSIARIDAFSYGKLRYGNLGSYGWSAYATDAIQGSY
ncbi:MAG: hypothetical protein JWM74_1495 [Myxococcaceae bacterium]|nr:hypothetical protein [Myxococcaceae bacterium]